jgi:hypothetical protein
MRACAHSRLALRMLHEFGRCAEGSIAREWTCWKPRSRAPEGLPSDGPRTIPQRPCRTTPAKSQPHKANQIRRQFHLNDYGFGPTRESGVYPYGVVKQSISLYSFYGQPTTILLAYADAAPGCACSRRATGGRKRVTL